MKIAHLFYNLNIGGSETMVIDIMNRQAESEEVALVIINRENDARLLQTIDSRIKKYIIGRKLGAKNPYPFFRLNVLLYRLSPDVVHIHNHHIMPALVRLKKARYFFTAHTNGIDIMQQKRFDKIFSISEYVAQDIQQRYHRPSEVIYNGIKTTDITVKTGNEETPRFRMVQIGRQQMHQKGQDLLLRALHLLIHRHHLTDWSADLIGDGPDTDELKRLACELGLENQVTFLGARDRKYIYRHLHEYQLLVHPSRQEGFGLTIAEAVCAGVPVLIPDIQGPMEIIDGGKYGTSFETGNAEMCAEKIAAIMQHYPEYLAKAYPAREFALSHFDIATTAQNYIKAYQTP